MDQIGFGDLILHQDEDGFKYGTDAVLLADMVASQSKIKKATRIIDLGTGSGIIPLILSHKTEADQIWGLEVQPKQYELAKKNVEENNLSHRLKMVLGDVRDIGKTAGAIDGADELLPGIWDIVASNPPYMEAEQGLKNAEDSKAIARHEILGCLDDFVGSAKYLLKDFGELYLVHRPSRLVDIIETLRRHRLEPKVLQMVKGKPKEEPNILLIKAVKNGGKELKVLPELTVRNNDGTFTDEMLKIYERKV